MRFEDVSAGAGSALQSTAAHRGGVTGDLDNDGRLDIVVTVLNGRAKLLRNVTTGGGASRDPHVHFGLGRFRSVRELEIRWPSGTRQILRNLPGNAIHQVREPD